MKKFLTAFAVTSILGALSVTPSYATRTIRADQSMNELGTIGEEWGNATSFFDPASGNGWLDEVALQDKIDVGSGPQSLVACFSENGFVSLYADANCGGKDGFTPDSSNEITPAIFDFNTDGVADNWKKGIVIPGFPVASTQYDSLAFTWNNNTQLIFLMLGNGDFNIEFNYADPLPAVSDGQQIFSFGGVDISGLAPTSADGFSGQEDICFRSGARAACDAIRSVPEPSTWTLMFAGFLATFAAVRLMNRRAPASMAC